jgi:hypothetical protein
LIYRYENKIRRNYPIIMRMGQKVNPSTLKHKSQGSLRVDLERRVPPCVKIRLRPPSNGSSAIVASESVKQFLKALMI